MVRGQGSEVDKERRRRKGMDYVEGLSMFNETQR